MSKHFTNAISRGFGKFASKEFSSGFQKIVNKSYVKLMKLDMSEFEAPEVYASLNALFTRNLKVQRKFSEDLHVMISPCDALISECGSIDEKLAMQIKGMSYNVDALLGDKVLDESKALIHGGEYCNWYLSPRDYHRYHMPIDCQVLQAIYIPGKLYPVNMPALNNIASLFVENERVVLECIAQGKRFYMVMVGALNVGKMQISFAPEIQTNAAANEVQAYTYDNLHFKKGDDYGCFEMGSTIVILSEKGLFEYDIKVGENVKFAQSIAKVSS
ncbi:MAG: phosphatidylserine decarboxylase [Campylobacterota bacterium]|nr:phosphatidylserine decarboxylase [Campylobacterota bacterium]